MKPIKRIMDHALLTASDQEILDYVAAHLLRQNEESLDVDFTCQYRGPNGLKCAIGACLSDELIAKTGDPDSIEGQNVEDALRMLGITDVAIHDGTQQARIEFLWDLQVIHDEDVPDAWPVVLRDYAAEHGLEFDEDRLRNAPMVDA